MPTLVVMAAGMGSRYGGLKQLEPIGPGGETLMDYSIYDAVRAGFDRVVFIIRRALERDFKGVIGARYDSHVRVDYAFQELDAGLGDFALPAARQKPWGTGHAILMTRGQIAEPFAVINADDYYGQDAFRALAEYLGSDEMRDGAHGAMVGYRLRNTLSEHGHVARGVCVVDADGFLSAIAERTHIERVELGGGRVAARAIEPDGAELALSGDEIVSMNLWGFHPAIFDALQAQFAEFLASSGEDPKSEFYIPSVVDRLIREGRLRLRVLTTDDAWFGMTYREDKAAAAAGIARLIAQGAYPAQLFPGASAK